LYKKQTKLASNPGQTNKKANEELQRAVRSRNCRELRLVSLSHWKNSRKPPEVKS
jgi:hypothetical protein